MVKAAKHLFLVFIACAAFAQAPQLKDSDFVSKSLGRTMHYRVLLPGNYGSGEQKYPVLYLLHGLYGNYKDWTDRTAVAKYVENVALIIVMPDANDSWYTNWATDPAQKYEDYIIKDLLAEIESHYRTINTRQGRWIAGLSMGGYGALKFGLKYPELFSVVGSFSGALNAADDLYAQVSSFAAQLLKVYGPPDNRARMDNDIFETVKFSNPEKLPYLYLSCGTADRFLSTNREFVASLPARKIRYEYHERPGAHEWPFWDSSLQDFLREFVPTLQH
jgi:putative tributyrin esterase